MRSISVFDIIGPIMIGPSSSHTAGALKIARVAGLLAKKKIAKVHFALYGSFAKTHRGHGTDRALVAGILGLDTSDYRIRESFELAKEKGIEFDFEEVDEQTDYHPNTVVITLTETDGAVNTLRGASVGGGEIEIHEINGCEIKFSAKNTAIIVRQKDKPGVIAAVAKVFENDGVNISYMSVYCEDGSDEQFSIIEIDGEFDEGALEELRKQKNVLSAVYIKVK